MKYISQSIFFLMILMASIPSSGTTPLIYSGNPKDITVHRSGDKIALDPSVHKGADGIGDESPVLDADIDNDGNIETIYLYNRYGSILHIEMQKHPPFADCKDFVCVGDWFDIDIDDDRFFNDTGGVTFVVHDFDGDDIPEIVLAYGDGMDLGGQVFKLNGVTKSANLSELKGLRNWFEPVGSFVAYDATPLPHIEDDTIITQVSPRGGVYFTYIYRNGKLRKLSDD